MHTFVMFGNYGIAILRRIVFSRYYLTNSPEVLVALPVFLQAILFQQLNFHNVHFCLLNDPPLFQVQVFSVDFK